MGSKLVKSEIADSPILECVQTQSDIPTKPQYEIKTANIQTDDTKNMFRKCFMKSFTYNLCDPRSPSINLNRTPLVVEDSSEKNLTLNDTFSDLFAETKVSLKQFSKADEDGEQYETTSKNGPSGIDLETALILPTQQKIDPRSPSIGVERTPISVNIYNDEDTIEDAMLENILSTLSINLNITNNTSVTSPESQIDVNETEIVAPVHDCTKDIVNKEVTFQKRPQHKPKHLLRDYIYEDRENSLTTTKKEIVTAPRERTPLSCVRNRSRSSEQFSKVHKPKVLFENSNGNLNVYDVTKDV